MAKEQKETIAKDAPVKPEDGKVRFVYGGSGGYDIDFPGKGKKVFGRGDEIALDPTDPNELRAILAIVKEINRKKTNYYIRVKDTATNETENVYRFQAASGMDNLPKVLREHKYTSSGMFTNDERVAILELCPSFQFEKRKQNIVAIG